MSDAMWYVAVDGQTVGPMSEAELVDALQAGSYGPNTDIHGVEMQFVEVELDPGESVVAEAGSMMYMGDGIEMETTFGDGSAQQSTMMDKLVGAGKRLLNGESLFITVFTHQ